MSMDESFIKKLDAALTNVGADSHKEYQIGGHTVWFSPVPMCAERKINEVMANDALKFNMIAEVKCVILANAIVGFDGFDLREFRNKAPEFPIYDPRTKKQVHVTLSKYLSLKMEEWGTEWIDSAFSVYNDFLETVKKENLKDVKFENAKDKREELAELEEKVKDLRVELGLSPLVESNPKQEEEKTEQGHEEPKESTFNPFQKIVDEPEAQPVSPPQPVRDMPLSPSIMGPSQNSRFVPKSPRVIDRSVLDDEVHTTTSSPERPYTSGRIAEDDIVEERSVKSNNPIVTDPNQGGINPRYSRPNR